MKINLIAVYGTLKSGFNNHDFIDNAGLHYLGDALTRDKAFVMAERSIPYVWEEKKGHKIKVELYQFENITDLKYIDRLEGHPDFYERKPYKFVGISNSIKGKLYNAYMYVVPPMSPEEIEDNRLKMSKPPYADYPL